MSDQLLQSFRSDLADSIYRDILFRRSNYYYCVGKPVSWGVGDLPPSTIIQSVYDESVIRSNFVYMEKIASSDVSLAIPRYNWSSGTVYDRWDDRLDMTTKVFYCVTDQDQIYKCLDNNGGVASTIKPTGKSSNPFKTNDGYLWKYLYSIPAYKKTKFSSPTTIPVQKALTDSFYNFGAIESAIITEAGTGYSDALLTTIAISGTTPGTGATLSFNVDSFGTIASVTVLSGGTGYANSVKMSVTTSTGYGAKLAGVVSGGSLTSVTINNGGYGYLLTDTILVQVGGASAIPAINRTTGSIEKIIILDSGAGYTGTVTATVTGSGGSGKYGNPGAVLKPIVYNGIIQAITIEDPGQNYPYDGQTDIVVSGDGTGVVFSPVIHNGSLIDVIVESPGTGYTSIALSVVGPGTGAVVNGIIEESDYNSDQSIIEQTAIPGAIYAMTITDQGDYYTDEVIVNIAGDGTGASATATVDDGKIKNITMTSFGSNYTNAVVTFTDPARVYLGTDKTAQAYAIFPPAGGHGSDCPAELTAKTVAINISLRNKQSLIDLNQDYRQLSLLKNPFVIDSARRFNEQSTICSFDASFNNVIDLQLDEYLVYQGIRFVVVSITGTTVKLLRHGNSTTLPIGAITAESNPARSYYISSTSKHSNVNKFTGKLLFVSNEPAFTSTDEQGIVIKTFFTF